MISGFSRQKPTVIIIKSDENKDWNISLSYSEEIRHPIFGILLVTQVSACHNGHPYMCPNWAGQNNCLTEIATFT